MPTKKESKVVGSLQKCLTSKKTAAANIIKNEASIRKEYEEFKGDLKRKRKGQFNDINEIFYEWFKKCCVANIYPDGPMLKEESYGNKKVLRQSRV